MLKRLVKSPACGAAERRFYSFVQRGSGVNLYIYSDESGVFDQEHYEWYAFGGVVFLDGESLNKCHNEFLALEQMIRRSRGFSESLELKSSMMRNSDRRRLYNAAKNSVKFGVLIDNRRVLGKVFEEKKIKQRFLDYAYMEAIKNCFEGLVSDGLIEPNEVQNIRFYIDEHTTATNGKYELLSALEQEFKYGAFNNDWTAWTRPIFPAVQTVRLKYCNSALEPLVRMADIVANKVLNTGKTGRDIVENRF